MTQAENEVLDTEEEVVEQEQEVEQAEQEQSGETQQEESSGTEAEDDSVVVTIGEESPPSEEENRAPEWVRELRKSSREKDRRIRELEDQVKTKNAPQAVELGEEPTLESCEYDEAKFKADWKAWNQRKQDHDEQERKKHADGEAAQKAWQAKLDNYGKLKSELKVKDFDEAEATVMETFNQTQQGIIVAGADNPAVVNYALYKNPTKLKELASITDPVKFAFAVAKLETQMKVTPRKTAPIPETPVRGNASTAGSVDSTLARLRADAEKTGDMSKVLAYKRQLRERAK